MLIRLTAVAVALTVIPALAPDPIPPCEYEDTVPEYGDCLWDAYERGNGLGDSFIAHSDGSITYLD